MNSSLSKWTIPVCLGFVAGLSIASVDNVASGGEVSPIVIVLLLLAVTTAAGLLWGRRGWAASMIMWACLPGVHVVKRLWGLADTLHPNTYTSILYLAVFTLVVAVAGTGFGILVRSLATSAAGFHQDRSK